MKLIRKIGSGNNSSAWSAQFSKGYKRKIVKRIKLSDNDVYCRFAWREAKCLKPRFLLKGVPIEYIRNISDSPENLQESSKYCISKLICATGECTQDGAQNLILSNTFLTEVAVGYCLVRHVNPYLPSATFCRMENAWITQNYGNIAMQYAGTSLEECINDLRLEELQSVVLQVLISLNWAQHKINFKHHDLHTGNVYVSKTLVPWEWKTVSGQRFELPSCALKAVIADFGLSAATDPGTALRHCRVDYELLGINHCSWGEWSNELRGNEGYDFSVLLLGMVEEVECKEKKKWLKNVEKMFRRLQPRMKFSKRTRPLQKVGVHPENLLQTEIFHEFLIK